MPNQLSERHILRAALAGIVLLILLSVGGSSLYQSGWSQGYMMGMLSSSSEGGAAMAPYMLYGRGFSAVGAGIGFFFKFAFFLFFAGMIAKFFGFRRWKMAQWHHHHGEHGEYQGGYGPGHHGPRQWRKGGCSSTSGAAQEGAAANDATREVPVQQPVTQTEKSVEPTTTDNSPKQ